MERSAAGEKLCRRRRGISEEGKRARWHGTYVYLRGAEGGGEKLRRQNIAMGTIEERILRYGMRCKHNCNYRMVRSNIISINDESHRTFIN